ncbi:hypothetical protein NUM_45050 [Actinocatenispora comari]|uniref:Uncharacterized protein n=1 Tax=Actinocatenispora comari TaxID=2807577 RepID=A0A8J4ADG2_9ACTN|nr:hypothetical protein NUM_45050 [Actinocatenispora comari]
MGAGAATLATTAPGLAATAPQLAATTPALTSNSRCPECRPARLHVPAELDHSVSAGQAAIGSTVAPLFAVSPAFVRVSGYQRPERPARVEASPDNDAINKRIEDQLGGAGVI